MLNIICALYSQPSYNAVLLGENSVFFVLLFLSAGPEVIQGNSKWSIIRDFCSAKYWPVSSPSGNTGHWWWLYIFSNGFLFSKAFTGYHLCKLWGWDLYTLFTCDYKEAEGAWRVTQGQGLELHTAGVGHNIFLLSPGQCFPYPKPTRKARKRS